MDLGCPVLIFFFVWRNAIRFARFASYSRKSEREKFHVYRSNVLLQYEGKYFKNKLRFLSLKICFRFFPSFSVSLPFACTVILILLPTNVYFTKQQPQLSNVFFHLRIHTVLPKLGTRLFML